MYVSREDIKIKYVKPGYTIMFFLDSRIDSFSKIFRDKLINVIKKVSTDFT